MSLVNEHNSVDTRKCSVSQGTINEWNKESTGNAHDSSDNVFKNRIDKCLIRTV